MAAAASPLPPARPSRLAPFSTRMVLRVVLVVVLVVAGAVADLPAAPAADVDLHRGLPRDRAVGSGRLAPPADRETQAVDRDRLHRADPGARAPRGAAGAAGRRAAQQPDQQPARLRLRPAGPRREERPAALARAGLQHHGGAAEAGQHAARQGRRRRRDPVRHRARPRELDLRRHHDPRAQPVHDQLGPRLAGLAGRPPGPGAQRVAQAPVRPDRQRGRQLRRGRARPGADRRRAGVHRAADPGRAVRRLARRRDLPARPRAARRRDPGRGARRRSSRSSTTSPRPRSSG